MAEISFKLIPNICLVYKRQKKETFTASIDDMLQFGRTNILMSSNLKLDYLSSKIYHTNGLS